MNAMTDMFDFSKNFENFAKLSPELASMPTMKAFNEMAAKYREVAVEALHRNVELTADWMKDAAKDAAVLMTAETQPAAYARKAGEVAQAAMQDIPARLLAYAEIAKKAQTELFDTAVAMSPKAVEEVAAQVKSAPRTAKKTA